MAHALAGSTTAQTWLGNGGPPTGGPGDRPHWVPKNPQFQRILSLDGGGIRGILTAVVLEGLENAIYDGLTAKNPGTNIDRNEIYLADFFDLIAGTSTGALLALYLASRGKTDPMADGVEPSDSNKARNGSAAGALAMYKNLGPQIFPAGDRKDVDPGLLGVLAALITPLYDIIDKFVPKFKALGSPEALAKWAVKAKFGEDVINRILQKTFAGLQLTQLLSSVAIPSFDIINDTPFTFFYNALSGHSGYASINRSASFGQSLQFHQSGFQVWQVARSSSAAPTFFPASKVQSLPESDGEQQDFMLVDGGVVANNPTLEAIVVLNACLKKAQRKNTSVADIATFSVGTGQVKGSFADDKKGDYGILQWIVPLISQIPTSGASDLVEAIVTSMYNQVLGGPEIGDTADDSTTLQYLRIQKTLYQDDVRPKARAFAIEFCKQRSKSTKEEEKKVEDDAMDALENAFTATPVAIATLEAIGRELIEDATIKARLATFVNEFVLKESVTLHEVEKAYLHEDINKAGIHSEAIYMPADMALEIILQRQAEIVKLPHS
eukprot:SM000029S10568  [mRNA]  locus=s29:880941:892221:+ [translate_table: standard]